MTATQKQRTRMFITWDFSVVKNQERLLYAATATAIKTTADEVSNGKNTIGATDASIAVEFPSKMDTNNSNKNN